MHALEPTRLFQKNHPALAAGLAGVCGSLRLSRPLTVCDLSEGARGRAGALAIGLVGERPAIQAADAGGAFLYTPGDTQFALAALLARITYLAAPDAPIAHDPESASVFALAGRLAHTDVPVLITGPTGAGKEVLAQHIHRSSSRAAKPFVAINCAAIPETMLEAMLFGHAKGSFTGANAAGTGFFREADGGTLLLDEIAEMPLTLQAKLLRALQEGEVTPVGATRPIAVDVRILACANRDLPAEVAAGRFREDLYYRLNVFPMHLPPLHRRPGDVAPLAAAMLLRHGLQTGTPRWIAPAALHMLIDHSWPGNVRELENVVRRALVLAHGSPVIGAAHIVFDRCGAAPIAEAVALTEELPPAAPLAPTSASGGLAKVVRLSEARTILETLRACNGKRIAAAKALGISERTLRYRLAEYRDAGLLAGAA